MTAGDPRVLGAARRAASAERIPLELLVACGIAESNLNPEARRPRSPADDAAYWPDVSFGAWQQTVRWAPEYQGDGAYPGPEAVEAIGEVYRDPEHAARVAAKNLARRYRPDEADAVFKSLCRYNWPIGNGEPASAAIEQNYRRGIAEARAMLGGAPEEPAMPTTYLPDAKVDPQPDDWSCSIQSLQWMLRSVGRAPSRVWLEQQLVPRHVTPADGLLDASGASLAAWISREYYPATSYGVVTFDTVATLAGHAPVMVGGRAWNHWSGVRGVEAGTGRLLLANPADGWKGIGQTMTRDQWASLGPWSLVTIPVQPAGPPPPPKPGTTRGQRVAALLRQLADELEGVE